MESIRRESQQVSIAWLLIQNQHLAEVAELNVLNKYLPEIQYD